MEKNNIIRKLTLQNPYVEELIKNLDLTEDNSINQQNQVKMNPTVDQTQINVNPVKTTNYKRCSCCNKILPIDDFETYGKGHRRICRNCRRKESGATEKFKDFTSRELIDELIARGYKGSLKKVVVEQVNL